jgi:hypothetical protein
VELSPLAESGKGRQGLTLASPILFYITMHGHRDPSLYREKILARSLPSLSSAESFTSPCLKILAEREAAMSLAHKKSCAKRS